MFSSRDRQGKAGTKATDTPQSSSIPATPVRQKSDASQANGAPSTPPKQAATPTPSQQPPTQQQPATPTPQQQQAASMAPKQQAPTPRTKEAEPVTRSVPTTNGIKGTSHKETSEVTILVKSTEHVSSQYESQLGSLVNVREIYGKSLESLLDFIASDRLRRVPHQGSRWDNILRMAEHFAIRISLYQEAVGNMFSSSSEAARMIWGSCWALLQLGPPHADLLEVVFGILFQMSLEIPILLRNRKLFGDNKEIKHELAVAYAEILMVVSEATVHYIKTKRGASTKEFHSVCGHRVDAYYRHREQITIALWSYCLEHSHEKGSNSLDVQTIREWLSPKDYVLRRLLENDRASRAEFTCEWFEPHLLEFCSSRNDMFLVTGASGCGKSVLSSWIIERLQRPLGRRSFDVISVKIAADLKAEGRSFNVVKSLLAQLLERRVGDVALYTQLCAVVEKSSRKDTTVSDLERELWKALEVALSADQDIVILIDGLDHLIGGETASKELYDRLHDICSKKRSVKGIVLTHPPSRAFSKAGKHFSIEAKTVHEDILHLVRQSLDSYHHFHDRKEDEKQVLVHRITDHVKGNFIFAELIVESFKREKTHGGFTQAVNTLPKTLHEAIHNVVSRLDLSKTYGSLVVAWLLAAERPLTVTELHCLLETEIGNEKSDKYHNLESDIHAKCGSLVVVKDEVVRIRHTSIRHYFSEHLHRGSSHLKIRDCQQDLLTRCIAYVKNHLTSRDGPSLEPLGSRAVEEHFNKHHLLEYTVRYWTVHFRASPMYETNGSHKPTPEFLKLFPDSVAFALMEWTCWELQSTITEAVEMHLLALSVRRSIKKDHESVLQSLMIVATTYEKLSIYVEASKFYYQASKVSQLVVSRYSSLTTIMAHAYLKCTASIKVTERNEVSNHKEEMLILIIEAEEHHHHSMVTKEIIFYKKRLAALYMEIKEYTLAVKIQHEVYRACVEYYGEYSSETMDVYGGMTTGHSHGLKGQSWEEHILTVYMISEKTLKIMDRRRVDATLRLFEMYEIQKNLVIAEEIIVTFLQKISLFCNQHPTTEHHQRKIEIVMVYVRFLQRHSRKEEAEHILRGVWCEYEHQEITTVEWAVTLKIIAEELKKLTLLTVALAMFNKLWGYFKKSGKKHSVEAISVAIYAAEISQEIQVTFTDEVVLQEVYEQTITTITTTTTTKIEYSTITTCEMLSAWYLAKERYSDALKLCDAVLKKTWISLTSGSGTPSLPKDFVNEAIKLATRQAYCYYQQRHGEKAEQIYVYVYQASRNNLRIGDETVFNAAKELIEYYESVGKLDQALAVGREIQESYSKTLGLSHALTLETLYLLGNLCAKHHIKKERQSAELYYLEIYTDIEKDSDTCHKDAIDAAMGLIRLYKTESRWEDCQRVYGCIWRTIIKRGKEYGMEPSFVDNAYHNYLYVLEKKIKVEYRVLLQVSVEYRDVCIELYGKHAEISLKALVQLAQMYERSEEKKSEAMKIYEVLIQETTTWTSISTTIITVVVTSKSRLAHLYLSSTNITTEMLTNAIVLLTEEFEHTRSVHGCSHHLTLAQLHRLIELHKRKGSKETIQVAVTTIRTCSVEVITRETDYLRLFDAAVSYAKDYILLGYVKEAQEMLHEMRRQIIFRDFSRSEKYGFKLDHSIDRRSYVFLVAFEETLKGSEVISFSSVMADLLTETILFELYSNAVKRNVSFETILVRGARLRAFQKSKHYDDQATKLEDDLFALFMKGSGSSITSDKTIARRFFIILLEEVGKDKQDVHISHSGWESGCRAVHTQLQHQKWLEAFELATVVWQFGKAHRALHNKENIRIGFKLSLALAGRGQDRKWDAKLRDQTLDLSKAILRECFENSRHHKFDFTKMDLKEINELVGVLGQQHNFTDLEYLLTLLWDSRSTQEKWTSSNVIWIGRRLVEVRWTNAKHSSAIALLEDIVYNLRRVWGPLDRSTLEMSILLSSLYTASSRPQDAMAVHEQCLRDIIINDDLDEPIPKDAAKVATAHAELLKRAYQRNGGWRQGKEVGEYVELNRELEGKFGKDESFRGVGAFDKWQKGGADELGVYKSPERWEFLGQDASEKHENILWRLERGGEGVRARGGEVDEGVD